MPQNVAHESEALERLLFTLNSVVIVSIMKHCKVPMRDLLLLFVHLGSMVIVIV